MGEKLSKELEELGKHLWWLGREQDASILFDIASKCQFYKIEDLEQVGNAMAAYVGSPKWEEHNAVR